MYVCSLIAWVLEHLNWKLRYNVTMVNGNDEIFLAFVSRIENHYT